MQHFLFSWNLQFSGKLAKKIIFLQFLSLLIIGIWTLYDGNFFMYGPRFIYEAVPILTILYGLSFYILHSLLKSKKLILLYITIISLYFYNIFNFELAWIGKKQPEYIGISYVPSNISELSNFNNSDDRFYKIAKKNKNQNKIFLMKRCENWWCYSGVWLNSYSLIKSKPLFISLPDDYKKNIKNGYIIDWDNIN